MFSERGNSQITTPGRLLALVERERRTRFSGGAFAGLWAYITPIGWIALIMLAFEFLGRTVPIAVPMPYFVASGILPYLMFRQIISSLMRTVVANRNLVYLPDVSRRDILYAAAVGELFNLFVTTALIFGGILVFYEIELPADVLRVIIGLGLAWLLGVGFGRVAALLGLWSDTAYRTIPMVLRPMFWISAIFFIPQELPAPVIEMLWFNPLAHAIETVREGLFLDYRSPVSDPWYPLICAFLAYAVSVCLERYIAAHGLQRHKI